MNEDYLYWFVWACSIYGLYLLKGQLDLAMEAMKHQIAANRVQHDLNKLAKMKILELEARVRTLEAKEESQN